MGAKQHSTATDEALRYIDELRPRAGIGLAHQAFFAGHAHRCGGSGGFVCISLELMRLTTLPV